MTKKHPGYEYKFVNVTLTPYDALQDRTLPTIEDAANHWSVNGWRTVSVIPSKGAGHADCLLIERVRVNPFSQEGDWDKWFQWNAEHLPDY